MGNDQPIILQQYVQIRRLSGERDNSNGAWSATHAKVYYKRLSADAVELCI